MWLATQHGFYSVVLKDEMFHVRARVRGDLERLQDLSGLQGLEIVEGGGTDYPFRLLVAAPALAIILGALVLDIDYPNFKDRIAGRADQSPKLDAYHRLWANLLSTQAPSRSGTYLIPRRS